MKLCKNEIISMSLAWNKEKNLSPQQDAYIWPPIHKAGALYPLWTTKNSWRARPDTIHIYIFFFFCRCWRFENINFSARCRTINSCTDWKWLAENINKCVERMAVRGGLSPPPGPMNQIHYCHSIVKHTSIDSINKLIIQLKNESLSRSL